MIPKTLSMFALFIGICTVGAPAHASILYKWRGDCDSRTYKVDVGQTIDLGCPAKVHGTLTVPNGFEEGREYEWESGAPFRLFIHDAWAITHGYVLDLVPFADSGHLTVFGDGSAAWDMSDPVTASELIVGSLRYFTDLELSPSGKTYSYYQLMAQNVTIARVPEPIVPLLIIFPIGWMVFASMRRQLAAFLYQSCMRTQDNPTSRSL
jgi:hypothetical protein